jgi:phosphoserine phosphatase RsbU/P
MMIRSSVSSPIDLFIMVGQDLTEIKNIASHMSRMQQELLTAKTVQETLFADPEFKTIEVAVAGQYLPATECGGDWWYYNVVGDKIYLWIGDVTGHGVAAAMVTSAVRVAVSFIESFPNVKPSEALTFLNRTVFDASKGNKYMSFFAASVDVTTGEMTYSNAGHNWPFLLSGAGDLKVLTCPPSMNLGQDKQTNFIDGIIKLKKGDRLFLYTDGVVDLENRDGQLLGDLALRNILKNCSTKEGDAVGFIKTLSSQLTQFRDGAGLVDDLTYFLFELKELKSR